MKLLSVKSNKKSVLVAEDESLIRRAICLLVGSFGDIEIAGEASNGREAVEKARILKPDLILMDLVMPVMDGAAATTLIKSVNSGIKVLALTAHGDGPEVLEALTSGMDGVVLKKAPPDELKSAINTVLKGERYIPQLIAERLARSLSEDGHGESETVTPREQQVLSLLISGCRTKEISSVLGISERTVEKHRDSLRKKYDVQTIAELVAAHLRRNERLRK